MSDDVLEKFDVEAVLAPFNTQRAVRADRIAALTQIEERAAAFPREAEALIDRVMQQYNAERADFEERDTRCLYIASSLVRLAAHSEKPLRVAHFLQHDCEYSAQQKRYVYGAADALCEFAQAFPHLVPQLTRSFEYGKENYDPARWAMIKFWLESKPEAFSGSKAAEVQRLALVSLLEQQIANRRDLNDFVGGFRGYVSAESMTHMQNLATQNGNGIPLVNIKTRDDGRGWEAPGRAKLALERAAPKLRQALGNNIHIVITRRESVCEDGATPQNNIWAQCVIR